MVTITKKTIMWYSVLSAKAYIVDFYAPSKNLVIEIDGGQHYKQELIERDKTRDKALEKLNLRVLRFSNLEILNCMDSVIATIFNEISIK